MCGLPYLCGRKPWVRVFLSDTKRDMHEKMQRAIDLYWTLVKRIQGHRLFSNGHGEIVSMAVMGMTTIIEGRPCLHLNLSTRIIKKIDKPELMPSRNQESFIYRRNFHSTDEMFPKLHFRFDEIVCISTYNCGAHLPIWSGICIPST